MYLVTLIDNDTSYIATTEKMLFRVYNINGRTCISMYTCILNVTKDNELKINKNLWNGTIYYL